MSKLFSPQPPRQKEAFIRGAVSIALFLSLWELLSGILPPATIVLQSIWIKTLDGTLIIDSLSSVQRVLIGYLIATILALCLGTLSAVKKNVGDMVRPLVDFLRPIPPIAWIPISLLWFGFGDPPAYFLVGLGAFFPVFSNTLLGVGMIKSETIDVARIHGASSKLIFWKVMFPQALPLVFSGLRTGLGVAWMVVITAELVGTQSGLGYMIQLSRAQLQSEYVVAGMVVIGIIGLALDRLAALFAKLLMPWRSRGTELSRGEA